MKILITGGTGFVGSALTRRLLSEGHQVTILSSHTGHQAPPSLTHVCADTSRPGDWQQAVPGQDVLINVAGRSIFHLWSQSYKKEIQQSRILTTRNLVDALPEGCRTLLLSASAAGYYGDGGDDEKHEASAAGSGFLADLCRQWEAEAFKATHKGARVAIMRFGVILGKGGGAMAAMKMPFTMGLGGPLGDGRQWFPWLHLEDLIRAVRFLIERGDLQGVYNFVAPGPVRQREFATGLGKAFHRPAVLPAPAWIVKLLLGEFGSSLLQGQKVTPAALLKSGFSFRFPELGSALREISGD